MLNNARHPVEFTASHASDAYTLNIDPTTAVEEHPTRQRDCTDQSPQDIDDTQPTEAAPGWRCSRAEIEIEMGT
jgi:hypothetical protein